MSDSDRDWHDDSRAKAVPTRGPEATAEVPATMHGNLAASMGAGALQRKIQRRAIQRRLEADADVPAAVTGDAEAPASDGAAMPEPARAQMEQAFGADFSDVRVHVGDQAPRLGAEAYTQGSDIHFAPGSYDPSSPAGLELVGHELAHVVQQRQGRVADAGDGNPINDDPALEAEADTQGAAAARGDARVEQAPAAANESSSDGAIQAKIARGSGWGAFGWNEGGAEAWGVLTARYDAEFTPAATALTQAVQTGDPPTEEETLDIAAVEAARKWDQQVIPYAEGIALSKVLGTLITKATTVSKALPERRSTRMVELAQVQATRLGTLGTKVQTVTGHIEKEHLESRKSLVALVKGWTSKRPFTTSELEITTGEIDLLEKAFEAAELVAAKAKPKAKAEPESSSEPDVEEVPVVVESSVVAALKKSNRQVYLQLLNHCDQEVATLNALMSLAGMGNHGKVLSCLDKVTVAQWMTLQALHDSSADELNRLLIAAGGERYDDVKAMLDALPGTRGNVDKLIAMLGELATDPGNKLAAILPRAGANMAHLLELFRQNRSDELLDNLALAEVRLTEVSMLLASGSKKEVGNLVATLPDSALLLKLEPIINQPLELRLLAIDLTGNRPALARVKGLLAGGVVPDKDALYGETTVKSARGLQTNAGADIPTKGLGDLGGDGELAGVKATLAHIRGGDKPDLTHGSGAKFGDAWANNEGRLPGVRGAGGYKEYYVEKDPADAQFHGSRRLLYSETSELVYYTDGHYGAGTFARLLA